MLSSGINKRFFTSSTQNGKKVMDDAAKTLVPVSLGLDGNNPMVVLADAQAEGAVSCACWASYQNCGQRCGGGVRVYVHNPICLQLLSKLKAKASGLRRGPDLLDCNGGIDYLTTRSQLDVVDRHVSEAVVMESHGRGTEPANP